MAIPLFLISVSESESFRRKVLLHYRYLPWHKITIAIKHSIVEFIIEETIALLEKGCQINREGEF